MTLIYRWKVGVNFYDKCLSNNWRVRGWSGGETRIVEKPRNLQKLHSKKLRLAHANAGGATTIDRDMIEPIKATNQ